MNFALLIFSIAGLRTYGLRLRTVIVEGQSGSNGDLGIGSKWEQWRWGSKDAPTYLDVSKDLGHPNVYIPSGDPLKDALVSPPNEEIVGKCGTYMEKPATNQFDASLDSNTALSLISKADHIYLLCVKCDRQFPKSWAGKISLVNVMATDQCLQVQGPEHNHYEKVTLTHKLIVKSAQRHKYGQIAVLEEDYFVGECNAKDLQSEKSKTFLEEHVKLQSQVNKHDLAEFIDTGKWDLLRLAYTPLQFGKGQGSCKKECQCHREALSKDVCTIDAHCDLRSSLAYMMRESIFDEFLQATGTVDVNLLRKFKQSYVTPPLMHQPTHCEDEVIAYNDYVGMCRASE